MAQSSITIKVDELKTSLERLEKLIRERYTQSIQNFFNRSTEQLRREIQAGFASASSAQASADLAALVEGVSKIEKALESLIPQEKSSQLAQDLTNRLDRLEKTMGDRLDSFQKQVTEISVAINEFTSEIMTPQGEKLEIKPGEQISAAFKHKVELREVLAALYDYLRWVDDAPGEMKAKANIARELEKAHDLAQSTHENGSLPLTLRNRAYEVARVILDTKKKISHSNKGRFYAEDIEELAAPLTRHLKHLISVLE